jgi:hypothetical protein
MNVSTSIVLMNNKDDCMVVYEYIPLLYILFLLIFGEKGLDDTVQQIAYEM